MSRRRIEPIDVFGTRIQSLRLKHGETGKVAALRCGISIASWYNYERGQTSPTLTIVKKIAAGYGITAHALLKGV